MRLSRIAPVVVLPLVLATAVGCSPKSTASGDKTGTPSSTSCAVKDLPLTTAGKLTVATDTPAYDPGFSNNQPSKGRGLESAFPYAVRKQPGFPTSQVSQLEGPFNIPLRTGPN